MKSPFLPLIAVPCVSLSRKTVFHKFNEQVLVEAPQRLIQQLVELCDGTRTLDQILSSLKNDWDNGSVRGLMSELRRRGVIVNSRALSDQSWTTVENPSRFPSSLSDANVLAL